MKSTYPFTLLAIIVTLAAAGSYSAFAGAGDAPGSRATFPEAQDVADPETPDAAQEVDGGDDADGARKVAQAIADEFGASGEEVLARHGEGIGFGALFKLYTLARAKGMTLDELLATIPIGDDGGRAWAFGQLFKALTDEEQAALDGSAKNLGQLVSAGNKEADGADDEDEADAGASKAHGPPSFAKAYGRR